MKNVYNTSLPDIGHKIVQYKSSLYTNSKPKKSEDFNDSDNMLFGKGSILSEEKIGGRESY